MVLLAKTIEIRLSRPFNESGISTSESEFNVAAAITAREDSESGFKPSHRMWVTEQSSTWMDLLIAGSPGNHRHPHFSVKSDLETKH